METTFYDDPIMLRNEKNDQQSLKRPVTLNLESPGTTAKRQRFNPILTSPDLKMLQLASPELERIIISNGNIITPSTPLQYSEVTEEQEQYARGFLDALSQLHQNGKFDLAGFQHISTGLTPLFANPPEIVTATSIAKTPSSVANQNKQYNTLVPFVFQPATSSPTSVIKSLGSAKSVSNPAPTVRPPSVENFSSNSCSSSSLPLDNITIKEELQTVPSDYSSPPLSPLYKGPIDMENQERIKLERKRQRNRIAASKCRKRKLEKISQLEYKVKELKGENSKLEAIAEKLRSEICALKENVLEHVKKGCRIQRPHFN